LEVEQKQQEAEYRETGKMSRAMAIKYVTNALPLIQQSQQGGAKTFNKDGTSSGGGKADSVVRMVAEVVRTSGHPDLATKLLTAYGIEVDAKGRPIKSVAPPEMSTKPVPRPSTVIDKAVLTATEKVAQQLDKTKGFLKREGRTLLDAIVPPRGAKKAGARLPSRIFHKDMTDAEMRSFVGEQAANAGGIPSPSKAELDRIKMSDAIKRSRPGRRPIFPSVGGPPTAPKPKAAMTQPTTQPTKKRGTINAASHQRLSMKEWEGITETVRRMSTVEREHEINSLNQELKQIAKTAIPENAVKYMNAALMVDDWRSTKFGSVEKRIEATKKLLRHLKHLMRVSRVRGD